MSNPHRPPTQTPRCLIPRNAHRSVIQGLILSGLAPVWIDPHYDAQAHLWGAVSAEHVAQALEQARKEQSPIVAVVVTSPTYEGQVSPIKEIAAVCHQYQALLIVDEAHGSLMPFDSTRSAFSACEGKTGFTTDVVIQSFHKDAGALTQAAMAHLPHGSVMTAERLQSALNLLQTTSPSYLLLASLEATVGYWSSAAGQAHLKQHTCRVHQFRERLSMVLTQFKGQKNTLKELDPGQDPSRLWLQHSRLSPAVWADPLEHRFGLFAEAYTTTGVLYLLHPHLQAQDLTQLEHGLCWVEAQQGSSRTASINVSADTTLPCTLAPEAGVLPPLPQNAIPPREAMLSPGENVPLPRASGRIAQTLIAPCPPGIPVVIPGQVLTEETLTYLTSLGYNTIQVCQ